jgi:hypothetical protein
LKKGRKETEKRKKSKDSRKSEWACLLTAPYESIKAVAESLHRFCEREANCLVVKSGSLQRRQVKEVEVKVKWRKSWIKGKAYQGGYGTLQSSSFVLACVVSLYRIFIDLRSFWLKNEFKMVASQV